MRNKIRSTMNFVYRHRVAIAVSGTVATCAYLHFKSIEELNEFLKEHELYTEYYLPES